MLKRNIYIGLIAVLSLFTYSCTKEDIGNYDYHAINEAKFQSGLNEKITGYVLKQLVIRPEVSFTMDDKTDPNRYEYEWVYVITLGPEAGIKTLAKTKDLDIVVNLAPATYDAFYRITDKTTGIKFSKRFKLVIRNEYNEGWLLMTDVNGKAQLDMLSKQENDEMLTVNDVLKLTSSDLQLKGNPRLVYCYKTGPLNGPGINLDYGLYLGTDQSTDRIHGETFGWQSKYNVKREILNPDLPEDFHLDVIKLSNAGDAQAYMISSTGDVFFTSPAQQIKYGQPLNYDGFNSYKVAPFVGANENSNVGGVAYFYDIEHKSFYRHFSAFDARLKPIPNPTGNETNLFPYVNTGKDLLYMTYVEKGAEVYALLKDPGTSKVYLARFLSKDAVQLDYKEIVSTDIAKGEHFAVCPDQGYIYYNIGGKVYQYDYTTSTATSKLVKDYGAAKVSILKFQTYHKPSKYTDGGKLIVCSYDPALPAERNAKFDQYEVLLGASGIRLEKSYTGFGKVVSLDYRER